jgi:hypothetical protein
VWRGVIARRPRGESESRAVGSGRSRSGGQVGPRYGSESLVGRIWGRCRVLDNHEPDHRSDPRRVGWSYTGSCLRARDSIADDTAARIVEEIVAGMREAATSPRLSAPRSGGRAPARRPPRLAEALSVGERDLDPRRGSLVVRDGKSGRRPEIGIDADEVASYEAARVARGTRHSGRAVLTPHAADRLLAAGFGSAKGRWRSSRGV